MSIYETISSEAQTVANLLAEQFNCSVKEIWLADPKKDQTLAKGASSKGANQYLARIDFNGEELEVSFFVKRLTQEQLESELAYVAAFEAAGLQELTYRILTHTPVQRNKKHTKNADYLLVTETIPGLEPLSHIIGFQTADDGTVLSERGSLASEYIDGALKLFALMHTQFYFMHGDSQPKNFNIIREAVLRARFPELDTLAEFNGVRIIDFEGSKNLELTAEGILSQIVADLESFFSYILVDAELLLRIKGRIAEEYTKFLSEYGFTATDLIDRLENHSFAFSI